MAFERLDEAFVRAHARLESWCCIRFSLERKYIGIRVVAKVETVVLPRKKVDTLPAGVTAIGLAELTAGSRSSRARPRSPLCKETKIVGY